MVLLVLLVSWALLLYTWGASPSVRAIHGCPGHFVLDFCYIHGGNMRRKKEKQGNKGT